MVLDGADLRVVWIGHDADGKHDDHYRQWTAFTAGLDDTARVHNIGAISIGMGQYYRATFVREGGVINLVCADRFDLD